MPCQRPAALTAAVAALFAVLCVAHEAKAQSASFIGSRVTTTVSATNSTTPAPIPGLSATLAAGATYAFDIELYTTSGAAGGTRFDLNGGTATPTALIGEAAYFLGGTTGFAALTTPLCVSTGIIACHIVGTITVKAGGTFIPEFAQFAANGMASTVEPGSTMTLQLIP